VGFWGALALVVTLVLGGIAARKLIHDAAVRKTADAVNKQTVEKAKKLADNAEKISNEMDDADDDTIDKWT